MKLMIDISEEDYKKCTDHLKVFNKKALKEPCMNATLRDRLEIALLHGTPLDDVKAKIEALPKTYPFVNHIDTYVKEDDVLQILDNIGKAESEDT